MYCEKCGTLNEEGSKFCIKCGAPLPVVEMKAEAPAKPAKVEAPAEPKAEAPAKPAKVEAPAEPKVEKAEAPELPKMPQAPEPQQTQQQAQAAQQQAQTQQQASGQAGQTQQSNFGNQFQGVQDQVTSGFHEFQNIVTGNTFKNYLIEGYKNPIEAVRIGCEGAMLKEGLIIYFAKDILCALFMMLRDLGHFPIMLIVLLALDAVQLFISLGIGKAFGGKASMAQWFGAMGGGCILTGTLSVAGYLLVDINLAFLSGLLVAVGALISIVVMVKTFEIGMDLHNNKLIYSIVVTLVLVAIAMLLVAMVFGAYIAQSQLSALEEMLQNFM